MTSGAEIYRSFHDGDVDRLQWALAAVNRLCQEFEAEAEELEAARDQMMAYWEGDSADAAGKGVSPLVGAHVDGAPLIDEAGRSIAAQADSFSQAKARVVPVPDEPAGPSAFAKFAGTIAPRAGYGDEYKSYRDGMADHAAANANNVRVMAQYKASTDGTRSVLPSDFGIVDDDGAAVDVDTRAVSAVSSPTAGSLATPIDRDDDITRSSRGRGMTTAKHPAAASRAGARMTSGGMAKSDSAAGRIPRGADAAARYSGGGPQQGRSVRAAGPNNGGSTAAAAKGATSVGRGAPGAMAGAGGGRGQGIDNGKVHKNTYAITEALDADMATEADELGEEVADEQTGITVVAPVVGDAENGGQG